MTQGADPFTGSSNAMYEAPRAAPAGGTAAGSSSTVTFSTSEHIPKKSMIFLDTPGKAEAVEKKVMEFNDALAAGGATSALALTAEEAALVRQLIAVAVDKDSMARPPPAAYDLIANKLLKWPQDKLFPVLDVLRMLITNMFAAKHFGGGAESNLLSAVAAVTSGPSGQVAPATRLMALRLYVNAFKSADTRPLVSRNCAAVLAASQGSGSFNNQQVHIGYGTLLINVAVHVREVGEEALGGAAVVRAAVSGGAEFLHTEAANGHEDGVYRVMAALGTICQGAPSYSALAKELGVVAVAATIASKHSSAKVRECAQQLGAACM